MGKGYLLLSLANLLLQPLILLFQDKVEIGWGLGQFLINLVAVMAAAVALYKYISSARGTMKKIEDALPTLFDIAKEFNPNSKDGDSLRHVIDELTQNVSTVKSQAELLLETATPPIFMADKAGLTTFVNNAWSVLTGLPAEDALGNGWTTAIHDDDRQRVFKEWQTAINDQRPFFVEFRFVNEHLRKCHHVRVRTTAIADLNRRTRNEIVAYIGQVKVLRTEDY